MTIKKILLIGPFPNPISGVSLANEVVLNLLKENQNYFANYINTSNPNFEENLGSFSFKKLFFFLKINLKIYKVLKFDIIYMTPGQTFFGVLKYALFILIGSIFKKELIIHVHGNYVAKEYQQLRGFKKFILKSLISKFDKGIVLSKSLKNNLSPFINEKRIYILNNFAENYLCEDYEKKNIETIRICFLSNLMKEKGILDFLEALVLLNNNEILFEAKIAGNININLKDEILNKIEKIKNVEYVGVVKGHEKKKLLNWSNIFILPTYYKMEGQPISILEAMATGNVIITTNHAGIPDIIKDKKNGYIIQPKNPKSIFEIVKYLYFNKKEINFISVYNRDYFIKNFTLQSFEDNFIKILKSNAANK